MIIFALISPNIYSQKLDLERDSKETIEWINNKLTEYQYENVDLEQIFTITGIERMANEYCIVGFKEQKTSKPWAFRYNFIIPISKINSVSFTEKQHNYWIEIKMKNNEMSIVNYSAKGIEDNASKIEIMLKKSIDEVNLKPRLLKAFNHLLEIYGNVKTEKF